ncbi:hypothetical protein Aglo03_49520 [Actinokineospora globicatena]|uniref:Uncharacterized protein n=1 Tax=Actinokineospora globicatena TaxID=103729 RepID=A0A9W6QQ72_9PSEU|nr:hypothetical protein Aglo03_49520 [Actinokineospora globicatena]
MTATRPIPTPPKTIGKTSLRIDEGDAGAPENRVCGARAPPTLGRVTQQLFFL